MIKAYFKTFKAGYDIEKEHMKDLGFEIGEGYEVKSIEVGRSSSKIFLIKHGFKSFNSVYFMFMEDGKILNIYDTDRFSIYTKI